MKKGPGFLRAVPLANLANKKTRQKGALGRAAAACGGGVRAKVSVLCGSAGEVDFMSSRDVVKVLS